MDCKEKGVELYGWQVILLKPDDVVDGEVLFLKQVHGGNIVQATDLKTGLVEADGVVLSKDDGVVAGIVTADCAPVIIVTDERLIALHVSRKTLIRGLLDKVVEYIDPIEIKKIYVGPYVCEKHFCFEKEGREVKEFISSYPDAAVRRDGKTYLSIQKALQVFFYKWGVSKEKIIEDGRCTYESDELPSYTRWCGGERKQKLKLIRIVISVKAR